MCVYSSVHPALLQDVCDVDCRVFDMQLILLINVQILFIMYAT